MTRSRHGRSVTTVIAAFAVLAAATPIHAQSEEEDIRYLLELTGAAGISLQIMDQLIGIYADAFPAISADVWAEVRAEIPLKDMVDAVVEIYGRYFTHEEIKLLLAFYQTDIGRKLVDVMPQMTEESMMVGQRIGEEWALELNRSLTKRGYIQGSGNGGRK